MGEINPLIVLQTVEHIKYAKPSCCAHGAPQSSQSAAEHMFRHALVGLIIPLEDGIDRHKIVIMALIHDITDFRFWDGAQQRKELNMTYLACNLPTGTAKDLEDHWSEYWDGKTPEARLAQEICAFEHLISLDEDGITFGDFYQLNISSPVLRKWLGFLDSSKVEMKDLQNTASFGSSYWKDPDENMRLLEEVIRSKLATSPLPYIRMLKDMSTIKRKGWIKRGMDEPDVDAADVESNASHSWGVAVICLLFSPKNEAIKCTILGLIHDLGEIVMGDVIPSEGIRKVDKHRHEQFGQRYLVHVSQANMMEPYFTEFEAGVSDAARITHEADSLECRIQAVIYILRYPQFEKLLEFLDSPPKAVYFHDLTNLLSKEENSLRRIQLQLTIIFVIGGPGVGKDTQCAKLAEALDFCHIPTGDLLRKEIERIGSRYSNFIQKSIDIGFTVPAELMISLLSMAAKGPKWLVNGFPRSFDQLVTFEQRVSRRYSTLSLDCPEEVPEDVFEEILRARLRKRATSSSRSDDKEDVIEKRLRSYRNEKPLRIHLQEKGPFKFKKIDSTGSEEEVYTLAKEGIECLQRAM